ncbi:unnamed protein product [Adineta ricciae]|uniref:Uncharacterized protein n=1 Tax=Adineta ricciae TaxID=249248 RepID=A0A814MMU9_ADIRI|nr:unnamed protein product [Adineta ricciae]
MKPYSSQIIIVVCLLFTHNQCQTDTDPTPVLSSTSILTEFHSTGDYLPSSILSEGITSSPGIETTSWDLTQTISTDDRTITLQPSSVTSPSPSAATSSLQTRTMLIYRYAIDTPFTLKLGNITDRVILTSVERMVILSFNLTGFDIALARIEIIPVAKDSQSELFMLADIIFQTYRMDCDIACIRASASSTKPEEAFLLPMANGTLVNVTVKSGPQIVNNTSGATATPVNHRKGDSPPGTPGRLAMGLSIPLISILLAAEILYFYRKYGSDESYRPSNQELSYYTNPPAV